MKPQIHRNIPHFHPHRLIRAAVWLIAMATETTQSHARSSSSQRDNPEDEDAYIAEKKGEKSPDAHTNPTMGRSDNTCVRKWKNQDHKQLREKKNI